jgi:hypothetical protein
MACVLVRPTLAMEKDENEADGTPASTVHSTSRGSNMGKHQDDSYSFGFLLLMIAAGIVALVPVLILGVWYHRRCRRRCCTDPVTSLTVLNGAAAYHTCSHAPL